MTEKTKKGLRIGYYVSVCLMLALTAILLMIGCVTIYYSGDNPFTPASIGAYFQQIALPGYLCLGLVVLGLALHPLFPEAGNSDPELYRPALKRLQRRTKLSACPKKLMVGVMALRVARVALAVTVALWMVVGCGAAIVYGSGMHHQSFGEVAFSGGVFGLCLGLPLALTVAAGYIDRFCRKKELALLKTAPAEAKKENNRKCLPKWVGVTLLWSARGALLTLALVLLLAGILSGGWGPVLRKAVAICAECIGLG